VNGLRDSNADSLYASRTSFASDYSSGHDAGAQGLKVLFKEHARKGSKDSAVSQQSRDQVVVQQSSNRPETKVLQCCYTNMLEYQADTLIGILQLVSTNR
jgi:hypothetical protein